MVAGGGRGRVHRRHRDVGRVAETPLPAEPVRTIVHRDGDHAVGDWDRPADDSRLDGMVGR